MFRTSCFRQISIIYFLIYNLCKQIFEIINLKMLYRPHFYHFYFYTCNDYLITYDFQMTSYITYRVNNWNININQFRYKHFSFPPTHSRDIFLLNFNGKRRVSSGISFVCCGRAVLYYPLRPSSNLK